MQGDQHSVSGEVVDRARPNDAPRLLPKARLGAFSIALLCIIAYLPGFFGMPPSNKEGHFAQASRQVFESLSLPRAQRDPSRHSALLPRVQDHAAASHGPAGHWFQAISAALFSGNNPYRDAIWMYRVPSLVAAFFVLMLTRRLAVAMFDPSAGGLAAILFALCPLAMWEARQADADMMAAAWTMLGISGLWSVWSSSSVLKRPRLAFWSAIAGGTLTAGLIVPIILIFAVVAVCALSRRWTLLRDLSPLVGLAAAGVISLWFILVSRDASPGTVALQMWQGLAWNRGWLPPTVHTILAPVLAWPGSLLLLPGALVAWKLRDKNPGYLFLIAWVVPAWLFLELMPGKSLSATLPLYPALAILGARAILAADAQALPGVSARPTQPGNLLWLAIGAALAFCDMGLIASRLVLWPASTPGTALIVVFAIAAAFIALRALRASWRSILKARFTRGAVAGLGVMLALGLTLPTSALPQWLGLPRVIGDELDRIDPSGSRAIAISGHSSDALLFLTRGRLIHDFPISTDFWINGKGLLIRDRAKPEGLRREVGAATGFDISTWNVADLAIEEVPP
jgi:4-amino-4-deoxy-L-arabinose transferase-like glycosyltransferase